jgi:acetyltransferase-like isoleucine patch superfamily enzyme
MLPDEFIFSTLERYSLILASVNRPEKGVFIVVVVGEFTYGHESIEIMSWGEGSQLIIGKYCSLAHNLRIFLGGNHRSDWVSTYPFGHVNQDVLGEYQQPGHPSSNGDVNIGNDVWIGHGALILSGITVGHGAIIGARCVITKDVEPYAIYAGNPAKLIRYRFDAEVREKLLELAWWNWPHEKVLANMPWLLSAPQIDNLPESTL